MFLGLAKLCGGESGLNAIYGVWPALIAIQLHVSFYSFGTGRSSSCAAGTVSYDGGMTLTPLADLGPKLTSDQRERYARQIRLPGFGEEGQRRLLAGRILVVGAGGLGSPALLYLAAAGVGTIGIVDDDVVDLTNLQRQVIHSTANVGIPKTVSAARAVQALNPEVRVIEHACRITEENAEEIISGYDVVLDGTDNFLTRYTVDAACSRLSVPEIWGSILRHAAQVSVFWTGANAMAHGVPEPGVCLRDLFPSPPPPGSTPSCGEAGVFGLLCGQVGSIMAGEAVKLLTGTGEPLLGRVLVVDTASSTYTTIPLAGSLGRPEPLGGQALAEACTLTPRVATIDVATLRSLLDERAAGRATFTLLDVREDDEWEINRLDGAVHVPLGRVLDNPAAALAGLEPGPVYVYCLAGVRSLRAAEAIADTGVTAVSVDGGIKAWWTEIDPAMPRY